MKRTTVQTRPRIGEVKKRRKKKQPNPEIELRIEWLRWLVEEYGADAVAEWQDAPVGFREWKTRRELSAHTAA